MSDIVIRAEHLSKMYRLGVINNGTLWKDLQTWVALKTGKEDPHSKIGEDKYSGDEDHFWALKDLNFEIKQGDRVGIIGKNGAGKSTLLKILSRITAPTEGTVKIRGKIASLLEVGTGFHGELTGRENIYLNGAILGMKKRQIDRKLDEIIDFSGIEHHIDTPVKRYSSGMYVRLAFAVAAHLDSHILIADEVLAVGDAEFQKKALGKMQDLSTGQGRTVLFVSHNMGAVRSLCNSGILLENGKLVFKAKNVNELYQKYIEDDFSSVERSKLIISNTDIKLLENSTFKFECMYIQDSSNNICNYTVSGDKEIYLTIEFSVASIDSRLAVYYRLYSQEGIDLYYSQQNDTDPEKWPVIKNGKNILKTKIPIDLLNEGRYFIELLCSIRGIVSIIPQNTVILGFVVSHNSRKSLFIKEERPGVLKPIIIWENVYRS